MTRQRAKLGEETSTPFMATETTENGAAEVLRKTIRSLTEQDPETPPSDPPLPHCDNEYALIPHLSHLLNAAASCLNVYLSLESLTRRAKEDKLQPSTGLNIAVYEQGMIAQGDLLQDLDGNIQAVLGRLVQTSLHGELGSVPSYISLLHAACMLPDTINELPLPSAVKEESEVTSEVELPRCEAVLALHGKCDELVRLCHGDAAEGIEGWKGCLDAVRDKMAETQT